MTKPDLGAARGDSWGSAYHGCPDFVGHVSKEFGLCSVGEFGCFSGSSVSLNGISQVEDHLVDLSL